MSRRHLVVVQPLPAWIDLRQLLGPGDFQVSARADGWVAAQAELEREAAADLQARLHNVGLGGRAIATTVDPPLPRSEVRRARTTEARRRRDRSPGFERSGAQVEDEARWSLTPEAIALELGRRAGRVHVVDAGCGAGGNAIGFARAGCRVTAIELAPARMAMARHNAALYGVSEQIRFVLGDALTLVPTLSADLLFVDPPWGRDYDKARVTLADLPLLAALLALRSRFARLWAKVPPSFDPASVPGVRTEAWFGTAEGDARRVKFLLLDTAPA